jgi:UDP-glucose:(heptosyl)LPS alpha-1,3-glucosyltransferase
MRIAFIVHDYHRGGGHSRYVAELATRFSQDHEVHVFANRVERAQEGHVIFHKVPALRNNVMTTLFSFAITSKFVVGQDFDIIHSQGFCGPRSNVITTHICNQAWSRSLSRFAGGLTIRERIFDFCASNLERRMYRHAGDSHVIAISKRVANDVVECYGCPAPIHLIYHGVDLETFSPKARRFRAGRRQDLGLSESDSVFLYVGDLRKGARQCIKALSQLKTGQLVMVSRSAPQPYQALAAEIGVRDRVHICPPTSRVEEYYGAADALLLPSPYDAFALVVTEAMACGLPVIVSREAGASELIEDRVNGILLSDVNNDVALAHQMSGLQADPIWAGRIGKAARITAERLSWDAVAKQTMRVYQEIAACRN